MFCKVSGLQSLYILPSKACILPPGLDYASYIIKPLDLPWCRLTELKLLTQVHHHKLVLYDVPKKALLGATPSLQH